MSVSIFRRLVSHKNSVRSAISRRNFSSCVAASGFPWLTLTPTPTPSCAERREGEMVHNFYSFIEKKGHIIPLKGGKEEADLIRDSKQLYWVGTSHGWLAVLNSGSRDMFLSNPLTGGLVELPPYRGWPFVEDGDLVPYKVVISHSPEDEECRAVMIFDSMEKAAFCTPGRSREWFPFGKWYEPTFKYVDVAYSASRKTFMGAIRSDESSREDVAFLNFEEEKLDYVVNAPIPEYDPKEPKSLWTSFLVPEEESGQLFLVRRYLMGADERVLCDVYRVDVDVPGGGIELCSSLDDLTLFVGVNHSFALKASDRLHRMKSNAIYHSGIWYHDNHMIDIFDYGNKTCFPCLNLGPGEKFPFKTPLPWFTPSDLRDQLD